MLLRDDLWIFVCPQHRGNIRHSNPAAFEYRLPERPVRIDDNL
jgi:hypothetical protein